jgi:hypothetical protein
MDNIQDLENQLLTQIKNLLSQINSNVLQLESLNAYITLYYKEISRNPYITPSIKIEILGQINNGIKEVKSLIDRLFIEIEILTNNLQRF